MTLADYHNNQFFLPFRHNMCVFCVQPAEAFMESWSLQNREKAGVAVGQAIRPQFIQAQVVRYPQKSIPSRTCSVQKM